MAGLGHTLRAIGTWRGRRSLVQQISTALAGPDGRVAVIGEDPALPGVFVVDPGLSPSSRHARLAGAGPFDLLVDGTADAAGEIDRFRESFLHVRTGGSYVVAGAAGGTGEGLAALLEAGESSDLTQAVGQVRRTGGLLSVERTRRTLAKLRERERKEALAVDPSRGRIMSSIPGAVFDSRCEMRVSRPPLRDQTKDRYEAPELFLREYEGVTCRPKSVVVQRGLLTPDTYRHHQSPRLTHKMLRDSWPRFAVTPKNEP